LGLAARSDGLVNSWQHQDCAADSKWYAARQDEAKRIGRVSVTQACERQETKPMSFFHVSERLCAAPEQLHRFLISDFPDKRLPYHCMRIP
jgi:hypothetical protein